MMNSLKSPSFFLLLAISKITLAQTYNVLAGAPSCAKSCSALTAAQSSCNSLYANGPFASVATCFCTNPQIATFGSNPAGICSDCSGDDATAAGQWFGGYCAQPATITGVQAAAATTSVAGGAPAAATTTSVPAATEPQASATNSLGVYVPVVPESYWSAHGRWIIMVIVLVVGFAIIIAVGVFLKKRHDKKRNGTAQLPIGSGWGPSHSSHPSQPSRGMDSNTTLERRSGYGLDSEKGMPISGTHRTPTDMSLRGKESSTVSRSNSRGKKLKKYAG